jgi:hypothetical protein
MVNGKRQQASSTKRSLQPNRNDNQEDAGDGQPAKRSRVSRACDQCRASREKCDGAQPKCQTCSSQNRSCSYNEQPKKRGIQPNYIRTLELALAWVFQNHPEIEEKLTSSLPVQHDLVRQLIEGKDATVTEALHSAWRESLVNRQIEQILSGSTIDVVGPSIGGAVTSVSNASVPDNSPTLSAPSNGSASRPSQPPISDHVRSRADLGLDGDALCPLPTDAWTRLEYYFAFTHSWLPMADKSSILKTMYSYPTEGLPRKNIASAEHAELWAIMALVSAQVNEEASQRRGGWERQLAESLLPTGNASFELPHIRASIILTMMDMLANHMLAAWLRIGSVVRLLYLFNLLKSLGQFTKWCRHIHLVAFVVESALALHMHTPGHMTVDYITSIGFVDEDGMEEWAPWQDPLDASHLSKSPTRSLSTLNQLVRTYMQYGKDQVVSLDATAMPSIALDLMKNAASTTNRIQPALLLTSQNNTLDWPSSEQAFAASSSFPVDDSTSNFEQRKARQVPNSLQDHPFMSIPNETGIYTADTSPAGGAAASLLWNDTTTLKSAAQPFSPEARMDGSSADIFEELASLERQDSIQQPQFLRNLGFSADLDLAEFFGDDYQMSDPLLAYLQPAGHVTAQNGLSTTGYT